MWDGEAKQAFSATVNTDLGQLGELVRALGLFTDKTSESRQEYDRCETTISQIISSIRV
jgi:ABC-type transporter Mla subunit MlaD